MDWLAKLNYNEVGYIPAIIQCADTDRVLTLCYMTEEALAKTLETGYVHLFRRSRGKLMKKGETSGMVQKVVDIAPDCDNNSLLVRVKQKGAGCGYGYYSCYYRVLGADGELHVTEERVFDPDEVYGKGK